MFTQLLPLIRSCGSLKLTIVPSSNGLKVCVIPTGSKSNEVALAVPLMLEATAEELDEKFADIIAQYHGTRLSLNEQVAATNAIMEAAKVTQSVNAVKAISGKGTGKGKSQNQTTDVTEDGDNLDESLDDATSRSEINDHQITYNATSETAGTACAATTGTDLSNLLS